jgi:hypothetical protein
VVGDLQLPAHHRRGLDSPGGIYLALVLPAAGVLAALLVLPGPANRVVRMDSKGSLFE